MFDEKVAERLKEIYPPYTVVVDIETTGNYPDEYGIVQIAAMQFSDPLKSFNGYCHIPTWAKISLKDMRKWSDNPVEDVKKIVPKHINDPERVVEPNWFGFDHEALYSRTRDSVLAIAKGYESKRLRTKSEKELVREFYSWLFDIKAPYENDRPVIPVVAHNASFDIGFIEDRFKRYGIGSQLQEIFVIDENKPSSVPERYVQRTPFTFAYRSVKSIGEVINYMLQHDIDPGLYTAFLGNEMLRAEGILATGNYNTASLVERMADQDYNPLTIKQWSKNNVTGPVEPGENIPYIQGQTGPTLDWAANFVGIDPRGGAAHDAAYDVMLTAEILARLETGNKYQDEFNSFEIPLHVSPQARINEAERKLDLMKAQYSENGML